VISACASSVAAASGECFDATRPIPLADAAGRASPRSSPQAAPRSRGVWGQVSVDTKVVRLQRAINTKADALGRSPLFEGLARGQLVRLSKEVEELDVKPGTVLCREGRPAREFFVIVEGEAAVTKAGEHVRRLGTGEFFGEVAMIERAPRATTVTALTPLRFFLFSSRAFWSVMHENSDLERRVLRALILENVAVREMADAALRRQAELNEYQALHDSLTGLPNRTLFHDRIGQAVLACERSGGRVAVLLMDLDRFKEVNDTLGHHSGDVLLTELGSRIRDVLRASDTVARLGGDEFGVLLPDQSDPMDVVHVMEKIRQAVERPLVVQDLPLGVEASVGVAFYPDHGRTVDALLQAADVAMYAAKETHAFYTFYDATTHDYGPARLTLLAELRRAIDERQLVLHFQPKAALRSGEVASVEALLRWRHPERGLVFPDEFIPSVQQTGLIKPLTLYVIDEALRQCRSWEERGLILSVAVNLSIRNLLDINFPGDVERLLRRHELDPHRLELEITESTMLADPLRTKSVLEKLSDMGVRISLDDFGTGYSSLSYLTRLPLDELKIDRSFVLNMLEDTDHAVIVRSTIDLGRNLGLEVVAEGVESAAIWDELGRLGCDVAQGYYLTRPVPADELETWLRDRAGGFDELAEEVPAA
jgi:diguanylate cyclase (GGDEF)-like protein